VEIRGSYLVPFSRQPKSRDSPHPIFRAELFLTTFEQAMKDAGEQVPVVLHRKNNKPWLAIMRLDDLPRLTALISTAKPDP
jgi:hypothetical protein